MKHELLTELKRISAELRRTPTVAEFRQYKQVRASHEGHFGTWAVFLQAAGLEPKKVNAKEKIKYDDIQEIIGEYYEKKKEIELKLPKGKILLMDGPSFISSGDLHLPFPNLPVLNAFIVVCEKVQPDVILFPGDIFDMFSHAKFPRSRFNFNPQEEMNLARKMMEDILSDLKIKCPNSKIIILLGNHDVRPMKRILETYPEGEQFILDGIKKLFTFDGATTHFDTRELVEIVPGVFANHGHLTQEGAHVKYYKKNFVGGHTHRGGTWFTPWGWELNCGLMGDPNAKSMGYMPTKFNMWTPGFGMGSLWGPRFLHFV